MAEKIAVSLERFGSNRFKNIIHKTAEEIMRSGAKGVEILLSGKVPSSRARTWRISQGYLKKCGEPALKFVNIAYKVSKLKSGVVGIIVKIMPPNVRLPDYIEMKPEEVKKEGKEAPKEDSEKKETKKDAEKPVAKESKKEVPKKAEVKDKKAEVKVKEAEPVKKVEAKEKVAEKPVKKVVKKKVEEKAKPVAEKKDE